MSAPDVHADQRLAEAARSLAFEADPYGPDARAAAARIEPTLTNAEVDAVVEEARMIRARAL